MRERDLKREFQEKLIIYPFLQKPGELNCLSEVIKLAELGPEAKSFYAKFSETAAFSLFLSFFLLGKLAVE